VIHQQFIIKSIEVGRAGKKATVVVVVGGRILRIELVREEYGFNVSPTYYELMNMTGLAARSLLDITKKYMSGVMPQFPLVVRGPDATH
jgi:hypothetical protein